MANPYQFIAMSDHPLATAARRTRRALLDFSLPAPRLVFVPLLHLFRTIRRMYYFCMRVFVCEPLFKAACKQYGSDVHTDVYIHWISGRGDIILGDRVLVDGKCAIKFATRYTDRPTLRVGNHSGIGMGCDLTIGKSITIGNYCRIASYVVMRDSDGHPSDPVLRKAGAPPSIDDVRPIVIEDNVWIGVRSIISPGVTIGEGSVVAAGSVVLSSIPPFSVVAGNPARRIRSLETPAAGKSLRANGDILYSESPLGSGDSRHE